MPAESRGAPAALRRQWAALVGAGFVLCGAAVIADVLGRMGVAAQGGATARVLAALGIGLGGAAATWSALERRGRDVPKRRTPLLLLAIGVAVIFGGQVIGYLITVTSPLSFESAVEGVPLLLGTGPFVVGMFLLCWPPGMSRRDKWFVVRDSGVSALSLTVLWVAVVVPAQQDTVSRDGDVIDQFDPWVQLLATIAVVVVIAASRRSGSLPIGQVIRLQGAVLVYLISDILGQSFPWLDGSSAVTYSVLGYLAAVTLFIAFAERPALQTDTPRNGRQRDLWSHLVPFLPVLLAGLAIVSVRFLRGPLPPALLVGTVLMLLLAVVVIVLDRIDLAWQRREVMEHRVATGLLQGTGTEWFEALIGDTRDLVTVVDRDGRIVYQTPSIQPMLGYEPQAFIGRFMSELVEGHRRRDVAALLLRAVHDEQDRGPYELDLVGVDGVRCVTETVITPLRAEGADGFVLTSRDVSDRRRLRSEFAESSLRDPLTGLANREAFLARLRMEVPAASTGSLAVVLFDLNAFRDLNDSRGHDVGDQVLRLVAEVLELMPAEVRGVARTGPDEFGLIIVGDPVEFAVGEVERALSDRLHRVLLRDGQVAELAFDLGYTIMDADSRSSAAVVEQADLALAEARSLPGGGVVRFDPGMRRALVERLRQEADLREALESGRLVVHYQPVVDLATNEMRGMEALARLQKPDGGLTMPADFIPLAESLGLVGRLGEIVLRQALSDAQLVSAELGREVGVAVNISAEQLSDDLVPMVTEALASSRLRPQMLSLELTETALAENRQGAGVVLQRLQELGCDIALDDFGTGYASMAYLADLPVDRLKIDRSFVGSIGASPRSRVLVRTLLQMTHSLGLTAVAEGIETVEQADLLRGMDCERGQGYLFARPMALPDLLTMLQVTNGHLPLSAG